MRYLLAFVITVSICLSAQANQWRILTPKSYMLSPVESVDFFVLVHMHDQTIKMTLVDEGGDECHPTKGNLKNPTKSFKVNGTSLRFVRSCLNGDSAFAPETAKDLEFFTSALSGGTTKIALDQDVVLHFESRDFHNVEKGMRDDRPAL